MVKITYALKLHSAEFFNENKKTLNTCQMHLNIQNNGNAILEIQYKQSIHEAICLSALITL